jgi:hypothetical protein
MNRFWLQVFTNMILCSNFVLRPRRLKSQIDFSQKIYKKKNLKKIKSQKFINIKKEQIKERNLIGKLKV